TSGGVRLMRTSADPIEVVLAGDAAGMPAQLVLASAGDEPAGAPPSSRWMLDDHHAAGPDTHDVNSADGWATARPVQRYVTRDDRDRRGLVGLAVGLPYLTVAAVESALRGIDLGRTTDGIALEEAPMEVPAIEQRWMAIENLIGRVSSQGSMPVLGNE